MFRENRVFRLKHEFQSLADGKLVEHMRKPKLGDEHSSGPAKEDSVHRAISFRQLALLIPHSSLRETGTTCIKASLGVQTESIGIIAVCVCRCWIRMPPDVRRMP